MKKIIFYFLLISINLKSSEENLSAVTYTFSGGRFGDNITSYLHAKWISHVHKIPLLYKPFEFSDQLLIHKYEQHLSNSKMQFKNIYEWGVGKELNIDRNAQTLYVIPYFPESLEEFKQPEMGINYTNGTYRMPFPYFKVDWKNKEFLEEIRYLVRPIKSLDLVMPQKDENVINVAMHVRKNSNNFDRPLLDILPEDQYNPSTIYVDVVFPLKHVPDRYYIEQLKKLISMFPEKNISVFMFTDDIDPEKIAQTYENEINCANLKINYRKTKNDHCTNILEDFFSMTQFDCFIRNDSNLSIIASKFGNYKVLIYPIHHKWIGRKLHIDEVGIEKTN